MDPVDVLIVGAGAAGSAVAWRLSQLDHLRVACLEQGDFTDPSSYPSTTLDWEVAKLGDYHVSPNVRRLPADYPVDDTESPIGIANFNAVGGSTILFSGHFPRFHPSDFRVRSLDGVADDWPLTYDDLEPYYRLNDHMTGVSGLAGDPAYPPIDELMPPVPIGLMGAKLAGAFNKLGWHWWPAYSAIITRRKANRDRCVNLGPCNTGCAQGAKSSADVTYWPEAIRNGVDLRVRSRVEHINVDEGGRVTGVTYFDADGVRREQLASIVVLACSGIGTPRLLLNSKSERWPDGLANSSGAVGRYLMLHPCGYVEGLFDDNLDSHLGPQGCCIISQEFYETEPGRDFVRGLTMQVLRGPGPLEAAMSGLARGEINWGREFHASFRRRFDRTAHLAVIVEDLPDRDNRVTLHPEIKDSDGIPAPKITYKMSENSRKILSHGLKRGRELMLAAGAEKVAVFGPVRQTGWHLMGTARMGKDPRTSVVNQYGQTHDVENLFVADSSIFVTSGAVNPASTLQALALRVAEHIEANIGRLCGVR